MRKKIMALLMTAAVLTAAVPAEGMTQVDNVMEQAFDFSQGKDTDGMYWNRITDIPEAVDMFMWDFSLKEPAKVNIKLFNGVSQEDFCFADTGIIRKGENTGKHLECIEFRGELDSDDDSCFLGNYDLTAVLEPGTYTVYAKTGEGERAEETSIDIGLQAVTLENSVKRNDSITDRYKLQNGKNSVSYFTQEDDTLYYQFSLSEKKRVLFYSKADQLIPQYGGNLYKVTVSRNGKKVYSYSGNQIDQNSGGSLKGCILKRGDYTVRVKALRSVLGGMEFGISVMGKDEKMALSVDAMKSGTNQIIGNATKSCDSVAVYYPGGCFSCDKAKLNRKGKYKVHTNFLKTGMKVRIFLQDKNGMYVKELKKKVK